MMMKNPAPAAADLAPAAPTEHDDRMAEPAFLAGEPAPADLDQMEVVTSIHDLLRLDPGMPRSLRSRLVAYAGLVLDGRDRAGLTPAGLAALARAEAAAAAPS